MAGCIKEKSYLDSYNGETEIVKQQFPNYSEHNTRVEIARRFRIRFAVDRASEAMDEHPTDDVSESISFTLDGGHVFYPTYGEHGTYLDSLHQNQKQYSHSYSESDHQTSRLAEEAFRNGATMVVLSYAREGETNRDLIIMKYDPATKEGKTFIVNTTVNGQEHSYTEILDIAKERFSDLTPVSPTATSAILTDAPLRNDQAVHAVNSVSIAESVYVGAQHVVNDSFGVAKYASIRVIGDVRETWMDIRDFFNKKRDEEAERRQKNISSPEQKKNTIHMQQQEKRQDVPNKKDIEKAVTILSVPALLTLREPVVTISALFALDTLSRIPEIPKQESDDVKRIRLEHVLAHTFVSETTKPIELPEKNTETELIFSIRRKLTECVAGDAPLGETVHIPDSETKGLFDVYRFFNGEKQEDNPEKQEIQKEEARVSSERFIAMTTPEEQKEYQTLERLAILYVALVIGTQKQTESPTIEIQKKKQRTDAPVLRLAQAFTLLLLFSQGALFDRLFQTDKKGMEENSGMEKQETTPRKQAEATPWLLLSIIWYLAQIREQGYSLPTVPVKKKTKKKKYHRVTQLPDFGVLYAYGP
jgi:hypothetical protein